MIIVIGRNQSQLVEEFRDHNTFFSPESYFTNTLQIQRVMAPHYSLLIGAISRHPACITNHTAVLIMPSDADDFKQAVAACDSFFDRIYVMTRNSEIKNLIRFNYQNVIQLMHGSVKDNLNSIEIPPLVPIRYSQASQKIPLILHFIWLGGDLPKKYYENILLWKELNPDHEIILWFNKAGGNIRSLNKEKYARTYDIHSFYTYFANFDLIQKELSNPNPNYSAMSDILRIDALVAFGGFYADLGITPTTPILQAISQKKAHTFFCCQYRDSDGMYIGTNDLYAASPRHSLFSEAQNILRMINKLLEEEARSDLLNITDPDLAYLTCRTRTGKAIVFALTVLDIIYAEKMRGGNHTLLAHQIGRAKTEERSIPSEAWAKGLSLERELLQLIHERIISPRIQQLNSLRIEALEEPSSPSYSCHS